MAHYRKQLISFLTAATCNLRCSYCYNPNFRRVKPEHSRIDVAFAKAALVDFFNSNASRMIRFFGAGEPTLAFSEMREIRDAAEKLAGAELRVELQTNGYFTAGIADWVEEMVDVLWISYDGPAEIQNRNRPGRKGQDSYDLVTGNVTRFAGAKDKQFGVRATVVPEDFTRLHEILDHFSGLGVKNVCVAPVFSSTGLAADSTKLYLLEFAERFADAFYYAQDRGMFVQTHLIFNFDEKVKIACRACTPCPHITTDGYVTCCDEVPFGPEYLPGILQDLTYGKWRPELSKIEYYPHKIEMIRSRNTATLNSKGCKDCPVLENCAGGCIPKSFYVSHDLYAPSKEVCEATRYLAERLPLNQGRFPFLHS